MMSRTINSYINPTRMGDRRVYTREGLQCPDCRQRLPDPTQAKVARCLCRVWQPLTSPTILRGYNNHERAIPTSTIGWNSGNGCHGEWTTAGKNQNGCVPNPAETADYQRDARAEERAREKEEKRALRAQAKQELEYEKYGPPETRCPGCGYQVTRQSKHSPAGYHRACNPAGRREGE